MRTLIPVENEDVLSAIRGFLKRLLEADVVDALLVPMKTPAGTITPTLVTEPALLDAADPLAPVMGLNAARVAGHVSASGPRGTEPRGRIGAVLRPCELRALVELVKLLQANLDELLTIGIDCFGTYDVPVYLAKKSEVGDPKVLWSELGPIPNSQAPIPGLRDACQMCERPHVEGADITIELFADLSVGIPATIPDEIAEHIALPSIPPTEKEDRESQRAQMLKELIAARTEVRDTRFAEMRRQLEEEGIEGVLAACVRCHNCMTVCPLCYCKTCLFESSIFDHELPQYLTWARRKGAYRLPADTMLFHLTRLNHMVLSCVGCGMCTSSCPAELPVGRVFRTIGQQVQATFDYEPGRSVTEPLPLITFCEDEWTEMGEE